VPHYLTNKTSGRIVVTLAAGTFFLAAVSSARADAGPPVKIRMPRATAMPAVAEQEYAGTIEIEVGREGMVDNFAISGEGWQELSIDPDGPHMLAAGETLTVQFRALPADAGKRMQFSLRLDGRSVVRSFNLSPERFAQGDRPRALKRLAGAEDPADPYQPPENEDGPPAPEDDGGPQEVTLHITGRLSIRARTG